MGIQQEGSATGRLDTGLVSCPSAVFKEILRWLPSSMLLLQACHAAPPIPPPKYPN